MMLNKENVEEKKEGRNKVISGEVHHSLCKGARAPANVSRIFFG
jgi:hypothetical protein